MRKKLTKKKLRDFLKNKKLKGRKKIKKKRRN
jgi:hypothetical protein